MAYFDFGLTATELKSLASLAERDPDALHRELTLRPWALHDLLSEPDLVNAVLEPQSIADSPSAFALFAVLVRKAADELLQGSHVNDWMGPGSRLPVFDVEPLREFVGAPGRVLFVARLLTSMVSPSAGVVPIHSSDPWELIEWLAVLEDDARVPLMRRLGDLSLFLAGVHADAHGSEVLTPRQAAKVGKQLGMSAAEVLKLADPHSVSPGLDALEQLGARWYNETRRAEPSTPPIVADVATRITAARRFLTHLADTYLSPLCDGWAFAA